MMVQYKAGMTMKGIEEMNRELNSNELLSILQTLLKNDTDLTFLLELEADNLQTLVACVRDRVEGCR
jgi:hypothetical protein